MEPTAPRNELVSAEGRNRKAVLCQRCGSRVLQPGTALFSRRQADHPETPFPTSSSVLNAAQKVRVPSIGTSGHLREQGLVNTAGGSYLPALPSLHEKEAGPGRGQQPRGRPPPGALAGGGHVHLRERGLHQGRGQHQVSGLRGL